MPYVFILLKKFAVKLVLRLERQGTMGFNDLVLQLAVALDGARGRPLIDVLAARYNVALIDEFQDTDAAQYHIFSTLFGG